MYGSISYNDRYELKLISTNCNICGLSIEIREGRPANCSACLQENPKLLEQHRKYLKGTPIAELFYEQ